MSIGKVWMIRIKVAFKINVGCKNSRILLFFIIRHIEFLISREKEKTTRKSQRIFVQIEIPMGIHFHTV